LRDVGGTRSVRLEDLVAGDDAFMRESARMGVGAGPDGLSPASLGLMVNLRKGEA
jgi:hypothetical protein